MSAAEASAVQLPAWLGDVQELTTALRRRHGFRIGMGEELRLVHLLEMLQERGVDLDVPLVAADWLSPVLCTSSTEQALFRREIEQWARDHGWGEPQGTTVAIKEPTRVERALDATAARSRHIAYALVGLIVVVALALYWLLAKGVAPASLPREAAPDLGRILALLSQPLRVVVALVPLIVAGTFVIWWRSRVTVLSRGLERRPLAAVRIWLESQTTGSLFASRELRFALEAFRRHVPVPSGRTNVSASLRATLLRGGLVTLVPALQPQSPSYVLLVDCLTGSDLLAGGLAKEIHRVLAAEQVHVARYDYFGDPRTARRHEGDGGWPEVVRLEDLAARHQGERLLVLGDGERFLSATGEPAPWIDFLAEFPLRVLLTPVEPSAWGDRELALERAGFQLQPATPDGFVALGEAVKREPVPRPLPWRPRPARARGLPLRLLDRPHRWLADEPPPRGEIASLLGELRSYLGAPAFELFCALAVFPAVGPALTLHLGAALKLGGAPLLDEPRLAALSRLPWLRRARIPEWLREALMRALPQRRDDEIRALIATLLLEAKRDGKATPDLAIVPRIGPAWIDALKAVLGREPEDSPLRNPLFLVFLDGRHRSRLAVSVPARFRRLVTEAVAPAEWAALVAGLSLTTLLFLYVDQLAGFAIERAWPAIAGGRQLDWVTLVGLTATGTIVSLGTASLAAIASHHLPAHPAVPRVGLGILLLERLLLFFLIFWVGDNLSMPILTIGWFDLSWHDLILISGGLFVIVRTSMETIGHFEGKIGGVSGAAAIARIVAFDGFVSLEFLITAHNTAAVPLATLFAIVVSVLLMPILAKLVGSFVARHLTSKLTALACLTLIGVTLLAHGLHFSVPRAYIYFAMIIGISAELVFLLARRSVEGRWTLLSTLGRIIPARVSTVLGTVLMLLLTIGYFFGVWAAGLMALQAAAIGTVLATLPAPEVLPTALIAIGASVLLRMIAPWAMVIVGFTLLGGILLLWIVWKIWRARRDSLFLAELVDQGRSGRYGRLGLVVCTSGALWLHGLASGTLPSEMDMYTILEIILFSVLSIIVSVNAMRVLGHNRRLTYLVLAALTMSALSAIWEGTFEIMDVVGQVGQNLR